MSEPTVLPILPVGPHVIADWFVAVEPVPENTVIVAVPPPEPAAFVTAATFRWLSVQLEGTTKAVPDDNPALVAPPSEVVSFGAK